MTRETSYLSGKVSPSILLVKFLLDIRVNRIHILSYFITHKPRTRLLEGVNIWLGGWFRILFGIVSSGLESVINNNGKVKYIKFYSMASHQLL